MYIQLLLCIAVACIRMQCGLIFQDRFGFEPNGSPGLLGDPVATLAEIIINMQISILCVQLM